jgi:hypothetical protein
LWKAATNAGWDVERLASWRAPGGLREREIVLYGEPLFAAVVAEDLNVALLEPPSDWLVKLPNAYRRRDCELTTLEAARRIQRRVFIKPAADKCFLAKVYDSGDELPNDDVLPGSTMVLVAEPVVWETEYRCFVLEREVLTLSPYLRRGETARTQDERWPMSEAELQETHAFAHSVLQDSAVVLPPAIALDIGQIQGKGWAVVEANAAWGSGIYGCDPSAVLKVITRACVKFGELSAPDKQWVLAIADQ